MKFKKQKRKSRFNKKASMALSMNAIVVIILAMSMLGVGVFIVNKIRSEAAGVIKLEPPSMKAPADSGKRLVLEREEIELEAGIPSKFRASIYNPATTEDEISLLISGDCAGSDSFTGSALKDGEVLLDSKTIQKRSEQTFWILITPDDEDAGKTAVCTLRAEDSSAKLIATADAIIIVN